MATVGDLVALYSVFAADSYTGENSRFATNVFINSRTRAWGTTWEMSANRGNGSQNINRNFTQEQLNSLTVTSSSQSGTIFLRLNQNETSKEIEITNYTGLLDMSEFSPGRIRLELAFLDATHFNVAVNW
ncbi:MAG: hypothetical protein FWG63_01130 [Defluviitaleaceae bacterium]|nr:hypothetical protein [Defluviitaleaceae bacterium]